MIAEENLSNKYQPLISISNANVVLLISKLMKQTVPHFKTYLVSDFYKKRKLNEDDFTQIYIEQAQILIRNYDYPFNINGQYRDITNQSKGFSDFYFYPNEQNVSTTSFFSVESKRLPSPEKSREKEYVIGEKNNGGIERYKTEKHGKGLYECGLLGFIEKENSSYWIKEINNWLKILSEIDKNWNKDEALSESESNTEFCFLKSIARRKSGVINLTHLWVLLN
ncbi:hypothetical protein [Daejeonella sp.]|uniref:hypothetical protein n=1 Tax=Daejeonella sp. TaxID=2805397 RepID=UPI00272F0890|nr:hypothetical protein [Daejeonella sp.]MDP2413701.1 hypothetical protein [Daejeonella sp.]